MRDWHNVIGTQKPEEIDRTSSPTTVYLRKNIRQVEQEKSEKEGEVDTIWEYEEKEMTVVEYENMLLMQQIVSERTAGIVECVIEFQEEAVIDKYTEQLIEEGLI